MRVVPATKFTSLIAVETWDAHYRWRDKDALHDTTVDATWWRVAESIASVEGLQAPLWAHRFADAFSRWRLLPDGRLLEQAGTNKPLRDLTAPSAVVNVAAFVRSDAAYPARFDRSRFVGTAALAVRLLDNALLLHADDSSDLHVGIIGLADAFRVLDMPFGSMRALKFATVVANSLAEGCLRGNVDAAIERGASKGPAARDLLEAQLRQRKMPEQLIEDARRYGVRRARISAIEPHPTLARLANEVADALDPLPNDAMTGHDDGGNCIRMAQARMIAAMQPYIDREIQHAASRLDTCFALASDCRNANPA